MIVERVWLWRERKNEGKEGWVRVFISCLGVGFREMGNMEKGKGKGNGERGEKGEK